MTAIASGTLISGAGNNNIAGAFDVIFPLITTLNAPIFALADHPRVECWGDVGLTTLAPVNDDSKVFWQTSPTYNIGSPAFLGSSMRAIPTYGGAPGANWADNSLATGGTAYPPATKHRALRGATDYLPLLPLSENFLGANNPLKNRIPFNLAQVIHSATSPTYGDLRNYLAIRYSFLTTDPELVIRGNTNTAGEPSATNIDTLDHLPSTHMKSIAGDDPALGTNRYLRFGVTASPDSSPYLEIPTSGYVYSSKATALV